MATRACTFVTMTAISALSTLFVGLNNLSRQNNMGDLMAWNKHRQASHQHDYMAEDTIGLICARYDDSMSWWAQTTCADNRVLRAEMAVIVTNVHARAAIVTGGIVMDCMEGFTMLVSKLIGVDEKRLVSTYTAGTARYWLRKRQNYSGIVTGLGYRTPRHSPQPKQKRFAEKVAKQSNQGRLRPRLPSPRTPQFPLSSLARPAPASYVGLEYFSTELGNGSNGDKGGDAVQISVQDASGTDNADMTTPADGSPGKMRMFLWDITNPERDGALENDIFLHEYTHGTRTGSRAVAPASVCRATRPAAWARAGRTRSRSGCHRRPTRFRTTLWARSSLTTPRHEQNRQPVHNEVHDIGEICANMLINVYAALVGASGFDVNAHSDASLTTGNALWMHLFNDALALQPCTPTFIMAHDAWIQADENRYNGANACTLWTAFASRGLYQGATRARKDNADFRPSAVVTVRVNLLSRRRRRLTYLNLLRQRRRRMMNLRQLKLPTRPIRRIQRTTSTLRTPPSTPISGVSSNE
ncbi:hypothetical protein BKA62DRAFT_762374 [Auriculariales sp. MPI-PUGE-AT-0066]|nr:hypothetical protein BKA62DRAFT_762374 [Auriculariales sp. MPI-PUGE-AT-0066]